MRSILIIILIIVIIFCVVWSQRSSEKFGQDASVRTNAGWVAGPNYGYDPISKFAKEIDEMKMHPQEYHKYFWGGGVEEHPPYFSKESKPCMSCMSEDEIEKYYS